MSTRSQGNQIVDEFSNENPEKEPVTESSIQMEMVLYPSKRQKLPALPCLFILATGYTHIC